MDTLFELPPEGKMPQLVEDADWRCLHCGARLTLDNFGSECVTRKGRTDWLGQPIRSHRFGNCYTCFKVVEIINYRVARSLLIP